jgi:2-polyprenyl-3-methyl-5-hydroxy-6-metoxy-1,4-benzoquinol methylase
MPASSAKAIPIRERSVRIGEVIVVNGHRVHRTSLKKRFAEGGYQEHETPHFLLFTRETPPRVILVHWFAPEDFDPNISHYLVQELKPFGILTCNQQLGELMTGIIAGTQLPDEVRRAWNYFGANTLQRLLTFVSSATPPVLPDYGTLAAAATLYQRVCELAVGERFLDAACNGGFLPLLLAERLPFVREAVGVDIDSQVFQAAQVLAQERNLTCVRYFQRDLLAADFPSIGTFDTVTALHVLEHFTEPEMYRVLANLLQVTRHRLILAVPYEGQETPEVAYDHKQLFTRPKLEAVGTWCLNFLQGAARMWCEDLAGGLLLIERYPEGISSLSCRSGDL